MLRIVFAIPLLRFLAAVALLAGGLPPIGRGQEVYDGIAAKVNEDVITFSQVRELVGPAERSLRETLKGEQLIEKIKETRLRAINDLIDRQLILQEFKNKKYQVPEHVIEERLNTIVREEFGGDRSAFMRTLSAQGFTLDRFRQIETDKLIVQGMRSQMVKTDPVVPEEAIVEYYEKNRAAFSSEEQVHLRLIAKRKLDLENDSPRTEIEEIRQKVLSGAEFGDLALLYSDDVTKEAKGDWGWINRSTLNETLTKVAFRLKPRQVSEVIDLGNSYYLLYVEAKKPAFTRPLKEVRAEIEKKLLQEQRQKAHTDWVAKLRKKAYIKLF